MPAKKREYETMREVGKKPKMPKTPRKAMAHDYKSPGVKKGYK